MDNQNRTGNPNQNEDWLDQILGRQNVAKELGPDELAVQAVGLTNPNGSDFERIVQETIAETWEEETPAQEVPVRKESQKPIKKTTPAPKKKVVEEEEDDMPLFRKLRPKAKGAYGLLGIPHILATVIWALLILFIGSALGRLAWVCAADLLALGKDPMAATIIVEEGDDITDVANKLEEAGLIRYPSLFETFAKITDKGNHILVGAITFDDKIVYDYNALINAMSYRGHTTVTVEVMIPEGYNCAQIFELLEKKGVCTISSLEDYVTSEGAKTLYPNYWFLRNLEINHKYSLEGFLFPDTYEFYLDSDPEDVIEKLLDGFDARFTQRLIDKYAALNKNLGTNFSLYEVMIVASIIEKESGNADESYSIASVFYNRLTHASSYPYLNSDATILYDTDYRSKGELVNNQQINSSPYNTYTQTGLPPTPIANPGLSSLDAALDPASTNYYFFIFDEDAGVHRFSATLAEHMQWANKLGY